MKKNTRLMGIFTEIKYGWNMTKEPQWIIELNSKMVFKLFRLLGGLCVVLVMSGISQNFHLLIKYYIFTIILIFLLLRLYIAIYFIWQFLANVYSGKFLVRNSPVNILKTMARVAANGARTVGGITVGTGFTYALCYELDDILVSEGNNPYFVPGLKKGIQKIGVHDDLLKVMKWAGITDLTNVAEKPRSSIEILNSFKKEERVDFEKLTEISWDDLYSNAKKLEDLKESKLSITDRNNFVKDLKVEAEKEEVFKDFTKNGKGKDKDK